MQIHLKKYLCLKYQIVISVSIIHTIYVNYSFFNLGIWLLLFHHSVSCGHFFHCDKHFKVFPKKKAI